MSRLVCWFLGHNFVPFVRLRPYPHKAPMGKICARCGAVWPS